MFRRLLKFVLITLGLLLLLSLVALAWLQRKDTPAIITYGISFNTMYARELGLDWQKTYDAMIDELGVRHLRLAAHWPMIEPREGEYNFTELDYQVRRAEEVGAEVILAVGRRLPRWPECHVPSWVKDRPREEQNERLFAYVEMVVNRYKDSPAVKVWQVENEPFLKVFAFEHCGVLDVPVLDQEIALIRSLDSTRPILVTDSGNLGLWYQAYERGDMFGTSVYVHFWNPELGQFRTVLPPLVYRVKDNLMRLIHGDKQTVLIELSAEPWLVEPIIATPLATQYTRMNVDKFADIVEYAKHTRYSHQYLWGGEWWYWLHLQGESGMWEAGKKLFVKENTE